MRFFVSLTVCVLFAGLASSLDKAEHCKCRIKTSKRIVGGKVASETEWPWMSSMSYGEQLPKERRKWTGSSKKLNAHLCGGVIINERWILSAARCVVRAQEFGVRLSIGVANEHDLIQIYDEGRIYVKQIVVHPDLNQTTWDNDLTLLELEEELEFNSTVLPGCLDTQTDRKNYGDVVATGYGHIVTSLRHSEDESPWVWGDPSRFLKELDHVDISETDSRCQAFRKSLCVESKSTGNRERDSLCHGDTGGPLHKTENGRTKIIGVASGSAHKVKNEDGDIVDCNGRFVFTRIGHYIDWIESVVGQEHC